MRETIAYDKDFITGSLKEEKKYKPEGMFRNVVTAIISDKDGNIIREEKTENIVHTKNIDFILFWNYYSPMFKDGNGARFSPPTHMPCNTLYLTDYNGAENAEDIFMRGKFLARATRNSNTVIPNATLGYQNNSETTRISPFKYHLVFDFPQNTANGTFQSVWLSDYYSQEAPFVPAVECLYSLSLGYSSYSYNNVICDADGFWIADGNSALKRDYTGNEISGTRYNFSSQKASDGTNFSSYVRIVHVYSDGAILVENTSVSNKLFKLSADRTTITAYPCNFSSVFGTTYCNGNIYILTSYGGNYGIVSIPLTIFETKTDLTLTDPVPFTKLIDIYKQKYTSATSISGLTASNVSLSVFEGKIVLSNSITYSPGNVSVNTGALVLDPTNLNVVDTMTFGSCVYIGQNSPCGVTQLSNGNTVYENTFNLIKIIDNGKSMIGFNGSDIVLGIPVPTFTHAKLPASITKDNTQSLKIVYDIEIQMPTKFYGNPTCKF